MPTGAQRRARDKRRLNTTTAGRSSGAWNCPDCSNVFMDIRGGRQRHEKACVKRAERLATEAGRRVPAQNNSHSEHEGSEGPYMDSPSIEIEAYEPVHTARRERASLRRPGMCAPLPVDSGMFGLLIRYYTLLILLFQPPTTTLSVQSKIIPAWLSPKTPRSISPASLRTVKFGSVVILHQAY